MSNSDSFIQEVAEEVRRDRLYGYARKYGWIAVVLVLGIVVGTGVTQYRKSQAITQARDFGDGLIAARVLPDAAARQAALVAVPAEGTQKLILGLLEAGDPELDTAEAVAALDSVIANPASTPVWRDLAVLRRVLLVGADQPLAERRAALDPIATPGRPYRALAAEQLALLLVEEGKTDEALAAFTLLAEAQDGTPGLRSRSVQMITALGGEPPVLAVTDPAAAGPENDEGWE